MINWYLLIRDRKHSKIFHIEVPVSVQRENDAFRAIINLTKVACSSHGTFGAIRKYVLGH